MAITSLDVWTWIGSTADRAGQASADENMTRIVTAIEDYWSDRWSPSIAVPVTLSTDGLITRTNHQYIAGSEIMFSRLSGGAPLANGATYYVRDVTADTFAVAATAGGVAIPLTTSGTAYGWVAPRPTYIDQALIMQAAALYDRRKTLNGVVAGSPDFGPFRVSRFDPDVERLLNPGGWAVA